MELLSPAGSVEQAFSVIEGGCDAVYGGLKKWNARKRAKNFTLKEYIEILEYCRIHQVKFYLTLNSLMKSDEVNEVLELFDNSKFPLPDAVIVGDIGLILELRKNFPELPIHASTQFGTCSVSDIIFLERLGVQRAILSRELSIQEISNLVKSAKLELEVFVYGMQCIAFSGQCLMGGLLQGGSGNRGLCSSPCFDCYNVNGNKGSFLKMQFLNMGLYLKKLEAIGVDSIKIEGRQRSADELSSITRYFRNIIDFEGMPDFKELKCSFSKPVEESFVNNVGFLEGNSILDSAYYSDNEDEISNNIQNFRSLNKYDGSYVYYLSNKKSRSFVKIHCSYNDKKLEGFWVENRYGKIKEYHILQNESQVQVTFGKVVSMFEAYMLGDIYNIFSKYSVNEFIFINENMTEKVIKEIAEDKELYCLGKNLAHKLQLNRNVWYETSDINLLEKLIDKKKKNIIFDIVDTNSLDKTLKLDQNYKKITYKLPILDFQEKLNGIIPMLFGCKIMLSKISQICLINQEDFSSISLEYTANIWNKYSLDFVNKCGFSLITAHPELSTQDNILLAQGILGGDMQFIQFGKIPLGYSRVCFRNYNFCDQVCLSNKIHFENVFGGSNIDYICNNCFGFKTIISEDCFQAANIKAEYSSRVILDNLPVNLIDDILDGVEDINISVLQLYRTDIT